MLKAALTRLVKGSLVYGIGGMLQRFLALLLLPFFTRVLTPEDYGVVAIVSLVGVAMSGLLTLGTGSSMGLLYFREENLSRRPTIVWTNLLLLLVNGAVLYVAIYLFAPTLSQLMFQVDDHAHLIRLALAGSVFQAVAEPLLAYLRMEERAREYVAITILGTVLGLALSVYFVLIARAGVTGLILAGAMTQGIMLFAVLGLIGRRLGFGVDSRLVFPLVRVGFPSIFGLFAFMIIDYADRQMIERMIGLAELGVYSIGYSFGLVMAIVMGAFSTAWPPFFMSYAKKPEEARQVFARVLTYYVIGFGSLIVLFFFVARTVVVLLAAPAFHEAYLVVGLVAAAYALKGCYLIFLPGIYFAEKLHRQSIVEWIAAAANIGLNYFLIPLIGIVGAAIATLASYLLLTLLAWFVSRRQLRVDYQWARLGAASAVVVGASALLFATSSLMGLGLFSSLLVGAVIVTLFSLVSYRVLLTENERLYVAGMIKA